jgi:hypothetical protein
MTEISSSEKDECNPDVSPFDEPEPLCTFSLNCPNAWNGQPIRLIAIPALVVEFCTSYSGHEKVPRRSHMFT